MFLYLPDWTFVMLYFQALASYHFINGIQSAVIQNVAAGDLTRTKKIDHIMPVLATLHWLPVKFRIGFKILLFVFKAVKSSSLYFKCIAPLCSVKVKMNFNWF